MMAHFEANPALRTTRSVDAVSLAPFRLPNAPKKGQSDMTKTLEVISEVVRNPKHPFPQLADRPDKPHKNRYERRKIKQFLHLGEWGAEQKS